MNDFVNLKVHDSFKNKCFLKYSQLTSVRTARKKPCPSALLALCLLGINPRWVLDKKQRQPQSQNQYLWVYDCGYGCGLYCVMSVEG